MAGSCAIVAVGKRRDGRTRYWCTAHKANATGKGGAPLRRCVRAREPALRPSEILTLDPSAFKGGIAVWGAVAPVYSTAAHDEPEIGVHVHARRRARQKKYIDMSCKMVRIRWPTKTAAAEHIDISERDAIQFLIASVFHQRMTFIQCTHCKAPHLDEDWFSVHPHRKHLCLACGREFLQKTAGIGNPLVAVQSHFHGGAQARTVVPAKRISKMKGKSTRIGFYKCYACRKKVNVKIGTIFEASHVPLHLWLQAFYLMAGSKKGVSANQLHRTLKVTLKTGWFIGHRIREAMRAGTLSPPMGGAGGSGVVEVDETFIGRKKGVPLRRGVSHKHAVLSLVERGGEVRSVHVPNIKTKTVVPIVNANVAREARIMTDDAMQYDGKLDHFKEHEVVNHSAEEYVRYRKRLPAVHTNTVESYFSVFKRGMRGIYQHCAEKHLHRYLAEFDFRYNARVALGVNDEQRAVKMVKGVRGKRLTYKATGRKVSTDAEAQGT